MYGDRKIISHQLNSMQVRIAGYEAKDQKYINKRRNPSKYFTSIDHNQIFKFAYTEAKLR